MEQMSLMIFIIIVLIVGVVFVLSYFSITSKGGDITFYMIKNILYEVMYSLFGPALSI